MKKLFKNSLILFLIVLLPAIMVSTLAYSVIHYGKALYSSNMHAFQKLNTVPDLSMKINEFMESYTKMGYFSGTVLVAKGGDIIINKGYGLANFELGIPNTPETKFRLGSLTKQFTAAGIMQLQEKGLLSVNDKLSKHIPGYPNGDKITLHHLLTHTSGIPDYVNSDKTFSSDSRLNNSIEQLMNRFKNKPLEFQPGTKLKYSNTGFFLLGCIIEKVSGKKYENFLNENIFTPLGMKNTGCDRADILIKGRASGYGISGKRLVNAEFTDMINFIGCGDLYSTTGDLYLWDRALYTEKLLNKKSLDTIFTNHMNEYGYGWRVSDSGKHIYHVGRINGFYTYIGRFPEEDTVIIVLANNWSIPLGSIYKNLDALVLGENYELPKYAEPVSMELK